MAETKTCSKCKQEKPLYEFTSDKKIKLQVRARCKKCWSKYQTEYVSKRLKNDPAFKKKRNKLSLEYWRKHHVKKPNVVCSILKSHSEEMKNDPDHLSTEFLQKLIGVKC